MVFVTGTDLKYVDREHAQLAETEELLVSPRLVVKIAFLLHGYFVSPLLFHSKMTRYYSVDTVKDARTFQSIVFCLYGMVAVLILVFLIDFTGSTPNISNSNFFITV